MFSGKQDLSDAVTTVLTCNIVEIALQCQPTKVVCAKSNPMLILTIEPR